MYRKPYISYSRYYDYIILAVKSLCSIPEESNIIVSCGADKKIVVWNVDRRVTGVVCELDGHEVIK